MFWRIGLIALLTTLLFLPIGAVAQEAKRQKNVAPVQKIDIDFHGGTISEMLDQIRKTNGITPNVIVSREAAQLKLPPITLSSVTVFDAMQAIRRLQEIDGFMIDVESTNNNVHTIIAYPKKRSPQVMARPQVRRSQVYDVKNVLGDQKGKYGVEDIATAIKTAWEMISKDHTGELKFHVETNLLIAVGTQDELNTAQDVLATLEMARRGVETARAEAKLQDQVKLLQAMVEELRAEITYMKKRLNALAAGKTDF